MFADIILGLLLLLVILAVVYVARHPGVLKLPTPQAQAAAIVAGVAAELADIKAHVSAEVAKVPALVDAQVVQLSADLQAATARAEKAEADLAAEQGAQAARLAAVRDQVGQVIAGIAATPAADMAAAVPASPVQPSDTALAS